MSILYFPNEQTIKNQLYIELKRRLDSTCFHRQESSVRTVANYAAELFAGKAIEEERFPLLCVVMMLDVQARTGPVPGSDLLHHHSDMRTLTELAEKILTRMGETRS